MPSEPKESALAAILRRAAIAAFFALVASTCWFEIVDWDFWWHLAAGEWIAQHGAIPTRDPFSYVAEGKPWIDSHWLFQSILYGAYSISGIPAVIWLRFPVVLLCFGLLFFTAYRREHFAISIGVCTLALCVCLQRFLLRPELFSLLFLAAFVFFTERWRRHPRTSLAAIAVCQLAWTNAHGMHLVGIALLAAELAGEGFDLLAARRGSGVATPERSARDWRRKLGLLAVALAMLLPNANGFAGMLYPFTLLSELRGKPGVFGELGELASPFAGGWPALGSLRFFYFSLVALVLAGAIAQGRKLRFAHLLPALGFFYLSTLALRNMSLFAIVATPVAIRWLSGVADSLAAAGITARRRLRGVAAPLALVAMLAAIASVASGQLYSIMGLLRRFGPGVSPWFPEAAVDYLERREIRGRIFNNPEIGGYLIWRLYPRHQVALDGRWEVYADPDLPRRLGDPAEFERFAKERDVEVVILHRQSTQLRGLGPWLRRQPGWKVGFSGRSAIVFERSSLRRD
jgi:hypothetical protein